MAYNEPIGHKVGHDPQDDDGKGMCYVCEERFNDDDLSEHPKHHEELICKDCLESNFTQCLICGEWIDEEDECECEV